MPPAVTDSVAILAILSGRHTLVPVILLLHPGKISRTGKVACLALHTCQYYAVIHSGGPRSSIVTPCTVRINQDSQSTQVVSRYTFYSRKSRVSVASLTGAQQWGVVILGGVKAGVILVARLTVRDPDRRVGTMPRYISERKCSRSVVTYLAILSNILRT